MQYSIEDGVRHSTAAAYIRPVEATRTSRWSPARLARRLLFDGPRCVGVEWSQDGRIERARAEEVVVCGGTIGSAQLLMLSGIGPADHLGSLGIDVVADLPGVGENLHDHLLSPGHLQRRARGRPSLPRPARLPDASVLAHRPGLPVPDIQPIHFMVPMYEPWMEGPENGFTLHGGDGAPRQPRLAAPQRPSDEIRSRSTRTSSRARRTSIAWWRPSSCAARSAPRRRSRVGGRGALPRPGSSPADPVRDYVRATAITYHHQVGTCKMGIDADAVVDPGCGSTASRVCAWRTRRSCRR